MCHHSHDRTIGHCEYIRFEAIVQQDIISVQFVAVFVVDHHFLHTLETLDEDVVHLTEADGNLKTDDIRQCQSFPNGPMLYHTVCN